MKIFKNSEIKQEDIYKLKNILNKYLLEKLDQKSIDKCGDELIQLLYTLGYFNDCENDFRPIIIS